MPCPRQVKAAHQRQTVTSSESSSSSSSAYGDALLAKHPRIQLRFTLTSGSWLNQVEISGIITRQAVRRGTVTSVKDVVAATGTFIDGWTERCQPFVLTKTADEILGHSKRCRDR